MDAITNEDLLEITRSDKPEDEKVVMVLTNKDISESDDENRILKRRLMLSNKEIEHLLIKRK